MLQKIKRIWVLILKVEKGILNKVGRGRKWEKSFEYPIGLSNVAEVGISNQDNSLLTGKNKFKLNFMFIVYLSFLLFEEEKFGLELLIFLEKLMIESETSHLNRKM